MHSLTPESHGAQVDRACTNLAPLALDTARRLRLARLLLQRSRIRYVAASEALCAAVNMLREMDRQIDSLRLQNKHLREELRRYTASQVLHGDGRAA